MVGLLITSPVLLDDCLTMAPPTRWGRKAIVLMWSRSETISIHDGDELLAIGYLWPISEGEHEFCLSIRPPAKRHMRALIRLAQLTFAQITQTGGVVATHVRVGHLPGERMARLTGFTPDPLKPGRWVQIRR